MFGSTVTLFRLFGIDIKVNLSWAFIAILIAWSLASGYFPAMHEGLGRATYWAMGVLGVFGIFGSILVHELAHSLVARAYGIPMRGITLHLFGGAAEMEAEPNAPRAEFVMAIAGPLTSVALALLLQVFLAVTGIATDEPSGILLRYLAMLNLVLAIFNMLPAFPLDGGRVLRAAIWGWTGDYGYATRLSTWIGAGLGLVVVGVGVLQTLSGNFGGGLWLVLIGLFIRAAAQTARLDLESRTMLSGRPVGHFMTPNPIVVGPNLSVSDFVEDVVYRSRHDVYPVVDGSGSPRGLVAVGNLHRLSRENWPTTPVLTIMKPLDDDMCVRSSSDTAEALEQMRRAGRSRLLVIDEGRLVGLLTLKDLLETLELKMELEAD